MNAMAVFDALQSRREGKARFTVLDRQAIDPEVEGTTVGTCLIGKQMVQVADEAMAVSEAQCGTRRNVQSKQTVSEAQRSTRESPSMTQ